MSYPTKEYFIKSINYIYEHIDDPALKLDTIAKEVGISVSSLKRLFEQCMEQSPGAFIRHLRMELAFRSLKSKNESILETALSSGFEDHSAFSRRFKETFGYSPAKVREKVNIVNELESITLEEPDIVELENLDIQCVTEKGLYFDCAPKAWAKLDQALNIVTVDDDFPGLFIGIGHDNPHEGNVSESQVRFSAGVAFLEKDLALEKISLSAGRYARFRYVGKVWNLGLAYHYIYGQWLQQASFNINQELPAFLTFNKFPDGTGDEKIIIQVPLII